MQRQQECACRFLKAVSHSNTGPAVQQKLSPVLVAKAQAAAAAAAFRGQRPGLRQQALSNILQPVKPAASKAQDVDEQSGFLPCYSCMVELAACIALWQSWHDCLRTILFQGAPPLALTASFLKLSRKVRMRQH